jgi:hypothetical protein
VIAPRIDGATKLTDLSKRKLPWHRRQHVDPSVSRIKIATDLVRRRRDDREAAHSLTRQLRHDRWMQPASGSRCLPFICSFRQRSSHMSQTAYPHTEAAYWLIHADDAFSLEVITPWDYPITVSPFSTAADAEAWIAEHRWRAQFESEARNSANGGAAPFPASVPGWRAGSA